MKEFNKRYYLEPYKGMATTRHECPACHCKGEFTRYVDENGNYLADHVGKCNRIDKCGYHYPPKQYFADNPTEKERIPFCVEYKARMQHQLPKQVEYIPNEYVNRSSIQNNTLIDFLLRYYEADKVKAVCDRYFIGSTKMREVIYWQIDNQANVRTGKIMNYDANGHRTSSINWVHSLMKRRQLLNEDFNLQQCLFGEHLLSAKENEGKQVALVESEKSAVICSIEFPQYVWIATGGRRQLNARVDVLKGRTVVAFPDADAVNDWRETTKKYSIYLSNLFEDADEEERRGCLDIADWMLIEKEMAMARGNRDEAWQRISKLLLSSADESKTSARSKYIKRKWDGYWQGDKTPVKTKIEDVFAELCEANPALKLLRDSLGLEVCNGD